MRYLHRNYDVFEAEFDVTYLVFLQHLVGFPSLRVLNRTVSTVMLNNPKTKKK